MDRGTSSPKRKVILVGPNGRPSMRGVVENMSTDVELIFCSKNGNNYRIVDGKRRLLEADFNIEDAVVIRWGCAKLFPSNKRTISYNKARQIQVASNKAESRRMFQAFGVPSPELIESDLQARIFLSNQDSLVVTRPTHHRGGKDFYIFGDYKDWRNLMNENRGSNRGWYTSAFVNKDREFRVHCAHGKVLLTREKAPPKEFQEVWNRDSTESFRVVKWDEYKEDPTIKVATNACLRAIESLGLDMGGVDVMIKDGVPYVLEVNTAPTLASSKLATEKWAKYFDLLFSSDQRREHWDYSVFKRGRSLIWKNFQLEEYV